MRIILSILFVLFCQISYEQDYIKIVKPENKWNILLGGKIDCGIWCTAENYRTHSLRISSDSIVFDTIYSKIISTRYTNSDTIDFYVGLIREDTIKKKVYFRRPFNKDHLIYDFSLNKGDTIKKLNCDFYDHCYQAVIQNVDSINLNFSFRKRLIVQIDNIEETWIEGIGSLNGLIDLQHIDDSPNSIGLLCFLSADTIIYEKELNQFGCLYFSLGTSLDKFSISNKLKIYSNPQLSEIVIENKSLIEHLSLYDMKGSKLIEVNPNSNYFNINTSDLTKGLYIISVNEVKQKILIR
jgi:hypothetical protein